MFQPLEAPLDFGSTAGLRDGAHTMFRTIGWLLGGHVGVIALGAVVASELSDLQLSRLLHKQRHTGIRRALEVVSIVGLHIVALALLFPILAFRREGCLQYMEPFGMSIGFFRSAIVWSSYTVWALCALYIVGLGCCVFALLAKPFADMVHERFSSRYACFRSWRVSSRLKACCGAEEAQLILLIFLCPVMCIATWIAFAGIIGQLSKPVFSAKLSAIALVCLTAVKGSTTYLERVRKLPEHDDDAGTTEASVSV